MRIVIDFQGAQSTGNRNRGIGRYSMSLALGVVRHRGKHEVILALNGLFPDTIESIRVAFDDLLPQENIRVWQPVQQVNHIESANTPRRLAAEKLYEAFLAGLKPDMVVITSLFEGLVDDAVISIGVFEHSYPVASILYDLIPLINSSPYLDNALVAEWYHNKIGQLKRADLLLSISESSRQEALQYLGLGEHKVVNISTAADPQFRPCEYSENEQSVLLARYKLKRPFVMYTGGIDHRKNIEGLIRAYSALPKTLRESHQLAIVCTIQAPEKERLNALARESGLAKHELILTGFVSELDLIALYNLCEVFVFPSWHEGFGLPALEAMQCGKAVIGANTSSLPEVIGFDDALFDPKDDAAITEKIKQVLTDSNFRQRLETHALQQAQNFTWDKTAQTVLRTLEAYMANAESEKYSLPKVNKPKLAYVSPLPPERSGISDYSTELLPELSRYYDIDVIVEQGNVSNEWIKANCAIRNANWLHENANEYDRILYHFGNSSFHTHMFDLLRDIPGVVVLHDFFLSGIIAYREHHNVLQDAWAISLYHSHGYMGLSDRFHAKDAADVVWEYPCNLEVLQQSKGVIVHSDNSRHLAQKWYGFNAGNDFSVIPLLRIPSMVTYEQRLNAREVLGLELDDFVICSFGMLNAPKLNHRLLEAWIASALVNEPHAILVFVGENDVGEYGKKLNNLVKSSQGAKRIHITGWVDEEVYKQYLTAADVGVQLRALSRGETSAAVLDCMNYGLATIVNANGSMADLDDDAVWKLPDDFETGELVTALETLWRDSALRHKLGSTAKNIILEQHNPLKCAEQYFSVIENFYVNAANDLPDLVKAVSQVDNIEALSDANLIELAACMDKVVPVHLSQKQLFVDISELVQRDAKSGIQRVVRSILKELLHHPPKGYRVEPVYATVDHGYRYACRFTLGFLDCPTQILQDEPIKYASGDVFFGLDLQPKVVSVHKDFYQVLRRQGIQVKFAVYDLLCVLMPQHFPDGSAQVFNQWLKVVAQSDGAVCISKAVFDELVGWVKEQCAPQPRTFSINWFHLGADVDNSAPTTGLPANAQKVLNDIGRCNSFLMVGTLEPRKGHAQVLDAFEQLWQAGHDISLVIVGKQGWMVEALAVKLRQHQELDKRLFWLEGISDEYLQKIYAASTCLIAASEGEGFGLPLIEAAQHKLPIVARDIPVFREVAGEFAYYFSGKDAEDLAAAIIGWLNLFDNKEHASSIAMPWLTWKESVAQLKLLLGLNSDLTTEPLNSN